MIDVKVDLQTGLCLGKAVGCPDVLVVGIGVVLLPIVRSIVAKNKKLKDYMALKDLLDKGGVGWLAVC